ncbi:hypothetical protein [Streptomyces sp. NRRL WC-3549]|uniref:hypothetical protein n=1 Tax=Streptomyces sp. NRRL WC-3549 TaxID=1463925 RepID=UPI0004CA717A|nr:hypothetical protein [Streptomyces sp. NRRL WC-3549]
MHTGRDDRAQRRPGRTAPGRGPLLLLALPVLRRAPLPAGFAQEVVDAVLPAFVTVPPPGVNT